MKKKEIDLDEKTTEKAKDEVVESPVVEEKPKGEIDPSFNCQECKGEGLKDNTTLCPSCHGAGKV